MLFESKNRLTRRPLSSSVRAMEKCSILAEIKPSQILQ